MRKYEGVTAQLAEYATSTRFDDLPESATCAAGRHLLDTLGVALRASVDGVSTKAIQQAVLSIARRGSATAIGLPHRLAPAHASMMNAALAHSLDFDDTHREGSVHPGAAIVPLVVALAEEHDVSGRRVLAAIVVGYDVTCRVARALDPGSHYARGFHPTGTAGVFGATAAGANLLGLDAGTLGAAFGINGSQASGSLQFLENGAWNKALHPALAVHNAVFALALAENGFVGAEQPLEGRRGLLAGYSDAGDPARVVDGLGSRFEILHTGLKPYPACRYAHAPLDMIIELADTHDVRPRDVLSVTVGLSDAGRDIVGVPLQAKRHPTSIVDGQFSMPFLAAAALIRRRFEWRDYDLLQHGETLDLASRVDVISDPESNAVYPERWLASVAIETVHGTLTDRRWNIHGEPESPMSTEAIEAKFDALAAPVLEPESRRGLIEAVWRLADSDHVAEISRHLAAACPIAAASGV